MRFLMSPLSRNVVPAPKNALTLKQALDLSRLYLENAYKVLDNDIALVLCHDAEMALSKAKNAYKKTSLGPSDSDYHVLRQRIATCYIDLGRLLERQGYRAQAQDICKKSEKWGGNVNDQGRLALLYGHTNDDQSRNDALAINDGAGVQPRQDISVAVASTIFPKSIPLPVIAFQLPEPDERLASTSQLAYCLSILQSDISPDETLEPTAHEWLKVIETDLDEQERLRTMAIEVVRAFKRDELKDPKTINEVVHLAPVLNKDTFQDLLREFYSGIEHSGLLNVHQVEGLTQLIQGAGEGYLDADDLVKILGLLSARLRDTHKQSGHHIHQLTLIVSHVLDAMADTNVTGLDREKLHEPLSSFLGGLKESSDPFLVYQAAYAFQALLCVPDNETAWQAAMRRTGDVAKGVSGLVSAAKSFDLNKFIEGLQGIHKGIKGASKFVDVVKSAYYGVILLAQGGNGLLECLKEGLSFERRRDWYSALRGADVLIRDGELALFRKLVCEAPCRLDPAFQWGVCQRLGEMAANPVWDADTRQGAIALLGEIYLNDEVWGQHPSVKQWIVNILMYLASPPGTGSQFHVSVVKSLLQELATNGDDVKQALFRSCREKEPTFYPLKVVPSEPESSVLLDRVQNRPDVEGHIRVLRKKRTKNRRSGVYIPPQAKWSIHATDDTRFPLMEKIKEFLDSEQKVFLILGDSGAGKSTFSRELEFELWQTYKNKTSRIPLHINLPSIDKPEHDMVAKQLRRAEFTEPQIREMKHYRKFVLICDGYDESQQSHNLYESNQLNQEGEWDVQMIISCRSEYLGADYQDRFQPGDRNQKLDPLLFQEAVISPFSPDQVHDYIHQYVSMHQPPWESEDYKQALEGIPGLKDLVQNPFLMTLSLEVLPRIVDPGQQLSTTRVTRVALYDHFVEQWLERGKKRVGEKNLTPNAREDFERLSEEGFTRSGLDFFKKLAMAIYMHQDGQPVVGYSQFEDEGSWKDAFFIPKDKRLLREACPMTRNGNQHRFVHRSLLEYGLALSVFDPQDRRNREPSEPTVGRRRSVISTLSLEMEDLRASRVITSHQDPDPNSPLVWRSFVNDHSMMQFLEERVQEEPVFKKQLLAYIEHSKKNKKWRRAAANAITILVRSGVQFIETDFQGIQIPGAELSYGVFDSVQLQGSDLRNVNLQSAWLRQTDLRGAQMGGAYFGELPYLKEDYRVLSCAYSPDGTVLAVSLDTGVINVYATSSWERIRSLEGHTNMARRIAYSPDGRQIASGCYDKTVRLWNAETGSCQYILSGHAKLIHGVAYSPGSDQVVSCSGDKTIRLWMAATGECSGTLEGHTSEVLFVTFSPRGQVIASGSIDSEIRLWDAENGSCTHSLVDHKGIIWGLAFSPQGNQLASACDDATIRLWDVETGLVTNILIGNVYTVTCVVYSPNGSQLASTGKDGTLRLWDVETGTCRHILTGHNGLPLDAAYSPTGNQIASVGLDKTVRLWDTSAQVSRVLSRSHAATLNHVKYSPGGTLMASCSSDSTIRVWDMETGTCRRTLSGHEKAVYGIAFSPRGDLIVSASLDKAVRLWDVETGECKLTLIGHGKRVNGVSFSPQGDVIASSSKDKTVRLWNSATGECLRILKGHTANVNCVIYSPDGSSSSSSSSSGSQIASGSGDNSVRLWMTESGECHQVLTGHHDSIAGIVYSPQGDRLCSASYDRTVRVWDVKSGDCSMILIGHTDSVIRIAFSAQSNLLASGSSDRTVRIWDAATGESQSMIQDFNGAIYGVDFDGKHLVTGCRDGSVLKWEVSQGEEDHPLHVRLCWVVTGGSLMTQGTSMEGTRGLSVLNTKLLKQRGAIGEPESVMGSMNKIVRMVSVVSKLGQLAADEDEPGPESTSTRTSRSVRTTGTMK